MIETTAPSETVEETSSESESSESVVETTLEETASVTESQTSLEAPVVTEGWDTETAEEKSDNGNAVYAWILFAALLLVIPILIVLLRKRT